MKASKYIITTVAVVLLVSIWVTGSKPLGEMVDIDKLDSNIDATLIRTVELQNSDGSITYENSVTELDAPAESEAAKALINTMSDITCRRRGFMLPFEKVLVYSTGQDSLSITFSAGGKKVDLVLLSGDSTLYDIGSKRRSFDVAEYTFEKLAKVVEQHGTSREQL